jgi:plasmid stabilization system protein ParE
MRLRWTAPAAQDLYSITRYIRRDNPTAARDARMAERALAVYGMIATARAHA